MAEFHEVPVVEVNCENIREIWPGLLLAIKTSTFIAIDTELSGLGERRQLFAKSIDDRYKAIGDVAKSRSIIALGLSCFKLQPRLSDRREEVVDNGDGKQNDRRSLCMKFVVQTFNLFTLSNESYIVEPLSLRFLVEHGFDFNLQYAKGLAYTSGNDRPSTKADGAEYVRQLFVEIVVSRVPVVLHNALVDLIFLYQSFYATLPPTLTSFSTDLSQIFSEGIYDTKYIAEFKAHMQASFLEYSFRKCQRGNCVQSSHRMPYVDISFLAYNESMLLNVVSLTCGLKDQPCRRDIGKTTLCQNFAAHGWCAAGAKCPNSHDVDMILDSEELVMLKKKEKRTKKNRRKDSVDLQDISVEMSDRDGAMRSVEPKECVELASDPSYEQPCDVEDAAKNAAKKKLVPVSRCGGHRAGFDAFMTGYIFASFLAKFGRVKDGATEGKTVADFGVAEELSNRVYLGGKDFPLQIASSNFSKPSKSHLEKWERLQSCSAVD